MFSLLADPWVPVKLTDGKPWTISLSGLLSHPEQVADITGNPMVRLAILRLLLAIDATNYPPTDYPDRFNLYGDDTAPGFLQVPNVPKSSAKTAWAIINHADANGTALNPNVQPGGDAETAQALIMAFIADRGGLKASIPGVPRSARKPMHMGKLTIFKAWSNLAEFLELNALEPSDWLPWWVRPLDFTEQYCESQAQLLFWPWRRITVFGPGSLAIAAGGELPGSDVADPFASVYASMKVFRGDLSKAELPPGNYDCTGMILNQALPVACRQWRQTLEEIEAEAA